MRYIWTLSIIPMEDINKVWSEFVEKNISEVDEDEWANVEPGDFEDFITYV